jgi:hypothetical protein
LYFAAAAAAATSGSIAPAISLTEKALKHLSKMRAERNEDLCLRIGVRQGGCSGMSYIMEFEHRGNASPDDSVTEYDGFAIGSLFILTMQYFLWDLGTAMLLLFELKMQAFPVCYFWCSCLKLHFADKVTSDIGWIVYAYKL